MLGGCDLFGSHDVLLFKKPIIPFRCHSTTAASKRIKRSTSSRIRAVRRCCSPQVKGAGKLTVWVYVRYSGVVDYPLKAAKFGTLSHLSIHVQRNFGAEQTRINYIGLRGEYQADFRQQVQYIDFVQENNKQ